jgi:hypothetical protein
VGGYDQVFQCFLTFLLYLPGGRDPPGFLIQQGEFDKSHDVANAVRNMEKKKDPGKVQHQPPPFRIHSEPYGEEQIAGKIKSQPSQEDQAANA